MITFDMQRDVGEYSNAKMSKRGLLDISYKRATNVQPTDCAMQRVDLPAALPSAAMQRSPKSSTRHGANKIVDYRIKQVKAGLIFKFIRMFCSPCCVVVAVKRDHGAESAHTCGATSSLMCPQQTDGWVSGSRSSGGPTVCSLATPRD